MKIRSGFVSNSSSSSFIVQRPNDGIYMVPQLPKEWKDKSTLVVPYAFGGEVEFGRQRENYTDFGSRLNWAYLQARRLQLSEERVEDMDDKFYFRARHLNDIQLLEKVLKDNMPGVTTIKWNLIEEHDQLIKNDHSLSLGMTSNNGYMVGYIDHQSSWWDRMDQYELIFKDEESVFDWLYNPNNYIANRSDEYGDADELEVDHRFDYEYFQDNLYYNSYNDPDKFDEDGKFIG